MSERWFVYLLRCRDGTFYCGSTSNLDRRLAQHNGLSRGGAKYTKTRRPVELLASVPLACRSEACKLEYAIKSLPKDRKLQYLFELASNHAIS